MKTREFNFFDVARSRSVPVIIYLPNNKTDNIPAVLYNHGYTDPETFNEIEKGTAQWPHKNHTYLAKFFTDKGYAFICPVHDLPSDNDGLGTIDPKAVQAIARKHLWERGMTNLLFVIDQLKEQNLDLNLEKFIIGGHSNGGDIAKYFANHYPELISHVIVCDGRRCPISSNVNLKILMFEANDTSTDIGVIPDEGTEQNPKRINLEWVVVKPKNALHMSYGDEGTKEVHDVVTKSISWFLD
jgi:predicted dienelactone hydrolase